jgi:hypothetical protein
LGTSAVGQDRDHEDLANLNDAHREITTAKVSILGLAATPSHTHE